MFRTWLSRPLYRKADIDARLDAVESLMSTDLHEHTVALQSTGGKGGKGGGGGKPPSLRGLPDMERLLSRVHWWP
jgi:DNA mismatch repair ATPase MutS